MARKKYWNSEAKNKRWIKDGRGQGVGSSYKPWLTVRDVASAGRSHRVYGHLTKRTHHLLSDLELATFLLLQWRSSAFDIREQFPLEREVTRQLCIDTGINHPSHQGVDQYMSSDFVVDANEADQPRFAVQVKPSEELENPRTVEKLEIERRFWQQKEIPWYCITENHIPSIVFENINLLYSHIEDNNDLDESDLFIYFELFNRHLHDNLNLKIKDLCIKIDLAYDHEPGESLYQIKRLLAKRYFHFDICKPFINLRCSDLRTENFELIQESWCVSN